MFFASDNQSCASQPILDAIVAANQGFTHGYGDDPYTQKAVSLLETLFECNLDVFFVPTGTAANCLALASMVRPWQTILCHSSAHVLMDESTAPEFFTGGARMQGIAQHAGKLSAEHIENYLALAGDDIPHNSQAGALSITQANELGLVYTPSEIQAISQVCQQNHLKLHMDGARFANAVAHLNCSPADITWKAGVDSLSLGATKCGALCAEAVIFFNKEDAKACTHLRKRAGHLISKGRIFGAQFSGWLEKNHWLELAMHANQQAQTLSQALRKMKDIQIVWPVHANEIFLVLPKPLAVHLNNQGAEFYDWYPATLDPGTTLNSDQRYIRLVTSFLTTNTHCQDFITCINEFQNSP
ncbi:MAG: low specificity L-threonine aldolase [Bermanella sp.]